MPTLAKINAQANTPLSIVERNHVRDILGVPNLLGNTFYEQSEARFETLDADVNLRELNKLIRAIVAEYDKIGERMVSLQGGSRGIYVKLSDDRARQARNLRAQIFPPDTVTPLDSEVATGLGASDATVTFVPIRYSNEDEETGEYAP